MPAASAVPVTVVLAAARAALEVGRHRLWDPMMAHAADVAMMAKRHCSLEKLRHGSTILYGLVAILTLPVVGALLADDAALVLRRRRDAAEVRVDCPHEKS